MVIKIEQVLKEINLTDDLCKAKILSLVLENKNETQIQGVIFKLIAISYTFNKITTDKCKEILQGTMFEMHNVTSFKDNISKIVVEFNIPFQTALQLILEV